jgi:hypothetical protein
MVPPGELNYHFSIKGIPQYRIDSNSRLVSEEDLAAVADKDYYKRG